jgi:hypothetical protein
MHALHAEVAAPYAMGPSPRIQTHLMPRPVASAPAPYYPPPTGNGYIQPPGYLGLRHPTGSGPTAFARPRDDAGGTNRSAGSITTASAATVARFAWFVAGAAFGITFAFFATGFFNSSNASKRDEAPRAVAVRPTPMAALPPPPVASPVAVPVVTAPPVAIAPPVVTAPAVLTALPVPAAPTTPSSLPNAAATAAPAPPSPRFAPRPARFTPAPRAAPREASAPKDVSDLLGAGLKP